MEAIDLEELASLLLEWKSKRVLFTFHSIGDTDSIASAIALSSFFKNSTIATPDIITSNAKRIMKNFGYDPESVKNRFPLVDKVVLLDVNSFEECGAFHENLENFAGEMLIIDHHAPKPLAKKDIYYFNNETYNSATSIVYAAISKARLGINSNIAKVLLAGIVSDSAEFRNATPDTFIQIGQLLKIAGFDYMELLENMQHVAEPESRLKSIEDIMSSKAEVKNGLLFMHGEAHAHANIAADYAIKIGADVALFYDMGEKEISFSARLRPPLEKKYNIHVGRIMQDVAKAIGGTGGGHPAAGGAYGPLKNASDNFVSQFIERILEKTRNR